MYYLYWQTFLLLEARIVTNQEITTVECEGNNKVLKTEGYCIERLNYHGPQFQKTGMEMGSCFVHGESVLLCSFA